MYIYYDENGHLLEQINDKVLIQNDNSNIIYCYFDGLDLSSKDFQIMFTREDGSYTRNIGGTVIENKQIPYSSTRDLRYFQYNKDYSLVEFVLNSTDDLSVAGLYFGNPQISISAEKSNQFYEPITFNVEDNSVVVSSEMTLSQYTYLLALSKGTVYASGIQSDFANDILTVTLTTADGGTVSDKTTIPLSSYLPLSGGLMNGNIQMGNHYINANTENNRFNLNPYGLSVSQTVNGTETEVDYLAGTINYNVGGSHRTITIPNATGTMALQEWVNTTLGSYLPLAGGTMTGSLTSKTSPIYTSFLDSTGLKCIVNSSGYGATYKYSSIYINGVELFLPTPTVNNTLATQEYISTRLGSYLPLAGGTLSGPVIVANTGITKYSRMSESLITVSDVSNGKMSTLDSTSLTLGSNGTTWTSLSGRTLTVPKTDGTGNATFLFNPLATSATVVTEFNIQGNSSYSLPTGTTGYTVAKMGQETVMATSPLSITGGTGSLLSVHVVLQVTFSQTIASGTVIKLGTISNVNINYFDYYGTLTYGTLANMNSNNRQTGNFVLGKTSGALTRTTTQSVTSGTVFYYDINFTCVQ